MNDVIKLRKGVGLIVTGLYEKERQKIDGEYPYNKKLIHGINIFQNLNYKYNHKNFDFNKMHEQAFIEEYAMKPIAEWFEDWDVRENLNLENEFFYYVGALVEDSGFNTFHISDECENYVEYFEKDIIAGMEQRIVYDYLKMLNQNEYVELRKYIIEHPIINSIELRKLKLKYSVNEIALQAIENAYEEINSNYYICPNCGWTLKKDKIGMRCHSRACTEIKHIKDELSSISKKDDMFRLRRGIMKYMAVPGKLELEIYDYCKKNKITSELWPNLDMYDIKITFSNGEVWAIDAKAVREPYFLREKIRQDSGFPVGDYTKGLYVIPDEYAKEHTDYMYIINEELKKMGTPNISCVKLTDLKKQLKRGAKII